MKNVKCFAIVLILLWSGSVIAQPEVLWHKSWERVDYDIPGAVIATPDGGCLLIGSSRSFEPPQYRGMVTKLTADGEEEWTKDYAGSNYLRSGLVNDDGYLLINVAGSTVTKILIDFDGRVIQQSTDKLPHGWDASLTYLPVPELGILYIGCTSANRTSVVQYDNLGNQTWCKLFPTEEHHETRCFGLTRDGDILAGGETIMAEQAGWQQAYVHKINRQGELVWKSIYLRPGKNTCIWFITGLGDGRVMMKGTSPSEEENSARDWTIITDEEGNIEEEFYRLCFDLWSTALLCGEDFIPMGPAFGTAFRYDAQLNRKWAISFPTQNTILTSICRSTEGGFYAFGKASANMGDWVVMKLTGDPADGVPLIRPFGVIMLEEDQLLLLEKELFLDKLVDQDTPADQLELAFFNGRNTDTQWNGERLIIVPAGEWWGLDSIKLTVTDPEDHSTSAWLHVQATSVNDPPEPFTLRVPADSVDLNNPMVAFVWNEATQNEYETDTLTYALHLKVRDVVQIFPHSKERTLVVDDLLAVIDELGFGNGDPVGMVEWWVTSYDSEDSTESTQRYHLNIDQIMAQREILASLPTELAISSIYPNPFNSTTTISYSVNQSGFTRMDVLDITGRHWATLVDGVKSAGSYSVNWSAGNVPTGLYILRISAGGEVRSAKIVLVK